MINYRDTILAQYANSPTITEIIARFNDAIDPTVDIDNFFSSIWDIETADYYGLNVWGKIVNVSRFLQVDQEPSYLGFSEAGYDPDVPTSAQPFGQAPFYTGPSATQTYELSNDAYRKLIMVKAMANITDCSVPSLNRLLTYLFAGEGRAYTQDTGEMQLRYVFEFTLSAVDLAIMLRSGVIPRPAGVKVHLLQADVSSTFGFLGSGLQPFGQGVLFANSGLQDAS